MMTNIILLSLMMLMANSQVLRQGSCPKIVPVENLNLQKYMGLWYEQVHTRRWTGLELKCNIEYLIEDFNNGYHLHSYMYSIAANRTFHVHGVAKFILKTEGKMMIKIDKLDKKGEVWILDTDFTSYTVMYSCLNVQNLHFEICVAENFVIMTRKPHPESLVINKAFKVLAKNKINATNLRFTSHYDCPYIDAAALSIAHCKKECHLSTSSPHAVNKEKQANYEMEHKENYNTEKPNKHDNKELTTEIHEESTKNDKQQVKINEDSHKTNKKFDVKDYHEETHNTQNKDKEIHMTENFTSSKHQDTTYSSEITTSKPEEITTTEILNTEKSTIDNDKVRVSETTTLTSLELNRETITETPETKTSAPKTNKVELMNKTAEENSSIIERKGKHLLLHSAQTPEEDHILSSTETSIIKSPVNSTNKEEIIVPKHKMIITSEINLVPPSMFIPPKNDKITKSVSKINNDNRMNQVVKAPRKLDVEDEDIKNEDAITKKVTIQPANISQSDTKVVDNNLETSTSAMQLTNVNDKREQLPTTTNLPEKQTNLKEEEESNILSTPLPENPSANVKESDKNSIETSTTSDVAITTSTISNIVDKTESTTVTSNNKISLITVSTTVKEEDAGENIKSIIHDVTTKSTIETSSPISSPRPLITYKAINPMLLKKSVSHEIHKKA